MKVAGRTAKCMDSENGSSPFQKSALQVSSVVPTRVASRMIISMDMESQSFGMEKSRNSTERRGTSSGLMKKTSTSLTELLAK